MIIDLAISPYNLSDSQLLWRPEITVYKYAYFKVNAKQLMRT